MVTTTDIIILPQISLFWLIIRIAIHANQAEVLYLNYVCNYKTNFHSSDDKWGRKKLIIYIQGNMVFQ